MKKSFIGQIVLSIILISSLGFAQPTIPQSKAGEFFQEFIQSVNSGADWVLAALCHLVVLPSTGRLTHYREPTGDDGIRVDTGVYEGGEISMYYDPMIAKVITHGTDRAQAIERMRRALDAFYIRGVAHNIPFLSALMNHPRFVQGNLSTNFIVEEFPNGFAAVEVNEKDLRHFAVVSAALHRIEAERATHLGGQLEGREVRVAEDWIVVFPDQQIPVRTQSGADGIHVEVAGSEYVVEGNWRPGLRLFRGRLDDQNICLQVDKIGLGYRLTGAGATVEVRVVTPRVAELSQFMRRTGAGSFILSGAIGDDSPIWLVGSCPLRHLVSRNPNVFRQSAVVALVTHT